MTVALSAPAFLAALEGLRSDEQREWYEASFNHVPGDVFLGVRMGQVIDLAKAHIDMPIDELERLLESPVHESRVGALSIMDKRACRAHGRPRRAISA